MPEGATSDVYAHGVTARKNVQRRQNRDEHASRRIEGLACTVRRNVPGIALALMVGVAGCVSAETSSEGDIDFSDVDLSLDGVSYNKRGIYIRPDNPEGQHPEAALCVDYFVSRENVAAFFKLATPMTNREIHDDQDLFIGPCFIEGRAKSLRTDARYRWTITGGGVGTICHPERGYQKFGCKGNCCKAVKPQMCLPEP